MQKAIINGQIVIVNGGKYHGQGAQVRKVREKDADVIIAGRLVKLKIERLQNEPK